MTKPRVWLLLMGAGLLLVALVVSARALQDSATPLHTGDRFVRLELPSTANLDDLGVADIDGDGWLDVYTTNHDVRPLILINQAGGALVDRVLELNLSTNRTFVGAAKAPGEPPPPMAAPGIYLYWTLDELVVRTHRVPADQPVSGVILTGTTELATTDGPVTATAHPAEGAIVAPFPAALLETQVKAWRFTAHGDSTLRIHSYIGYNVARVHISPPSPLQAVFIGSRGVNPRRRTFALWPDDRHAMLWFDLDGDGATDVVTVDGGMRGRSRGRVAPEHASYQPFLRSGASFREASLGGDLRHHGCPTRQASLVDFDRDGWLDIYVVCERPFERHHNQLFRQTAPGEFSEVAAEHGLDLPGGGLSVWLDVEGDGDMDLVVATADELRLFSNDDGRFSAQPIGRGRGRPGQLSVADFDRDGDLDLFVAAPEGSVLLLNEDGRYRAVAAEERGLPQRAWCASWVDFDNDGRLDLHALPGGIFRQHQDGRFEATGLLAGEGEGQAFCTWFDFDNDGARDFLVAREDPPSLRERVRQRVARILGRDVQRFIAQTPLLFRLEGLAWGHAFRQHRPWRLSLYRNLAAEHHWLAVRLVGRAGNRPALGARITVETAAGSQTQQVGQAEGSLRSQGHYRAYFGLGEAARVDRVRVIWPDGSETARHAVAADQLLVIEQAHAAAQQASAPSAGSRPQPRLGD